jgi:glutamine synthetase
MGIAPHPHTLADAIKAMEGSELAAQALGAHTFAHVLRNKRKEWEDYAAYVTAYEIDRYLGIL